MAGEPAFDAYSTRFQAAMFPTPDARSAIRSTRWSTAATEPNVIGAQSGFGEVPGSASWFGLDAGGQPVVLVTDFGGPGRPVDLKELANPAAGRRA